MSIVAAIKTITERVMAMDAPAEMKLQFIQIAIEALPTNPPRDERNDASSSVIRSKGTGAERQRRYMENKRRRESSDAAAIDRHDDASSDGDDDAGAPPSSPPPSPPPKITNQTPFLTPTTPPPVAAPRKASRTKPRTPIAEDAQPTDRDRKAAEDAGLDRETFRREWARFRDFHRAKGSLMADWSAAWRTWLGNMAGYQRQRAGPVGGSSSNETNRSKILRGEMTSYDEQGNYIGPTNIADLAARRPDTRAGDRGGHDLLSFGEGNEVEHIPDSSLEISSGR